MPPDPTPPRLSLTPGPDASTPLAPLAALLLRLARDRRRPPPAPRPAPEAPNVERNK
jgi:hypothetical protein